MSEPVGIPRRRFLGYVIAAPTLVACARFDRDIFGAPAAAAVPSGPGVGDLYDITNIHLWKNGEDGICLRDFALLINGVEVYNKVFGNTSSTCRWLDVVPTIKYAVFVNPLTYISEGLRGVLIPELPHMPLPAVLGALTAITAVFWRLGLRAFMKRAVG